MSIVVRVAGRRHPHKWRVLSALAFAWIGLAFCTPAHAEYRALLVGVSSYPTLPARYRLEGPRNDILRMRQVLEKRGFAPTSIETLADGVPAAAMPTRDNILAGLARLSDAARPADVVVILFAGHGSQEPADRDTPEDRRESDGLHETFLPIDVGSWDGSRHHVSRAILNYELRAAVDRISAKGAFVWGVFDSCHSATLVRGRPRDDEVRYRRVDPVDLGISAEDMARASTAASGRRPAGTMNSPLGEAPAGLAPSVLFYAAQTTELTPELPLPTGAIGRRPHGLFSFVVAKALETAAPMTYRQLAQYVLAEYGGIADAHVTPLFAGNGLDTLVLGQQSLPLRQWPLQRGEPPTLAAGRLSGIDVGAVFAVVSDPLAPRDEAVAHVEVVRADADRAELAPIAYAGKPPTALAGLPAGAYARLVRNPPAFALHVAVRAYDCDRRCGLADAVRLLRAQPVPGVDVVWVDGQAGADIVLKPRGDRIDFIQPFDEVGIPALSVPSSVNGSALAAGTLASSLATELHQIARARNLLRVAATFAKATPDGDLHAVLERRRGAGTVAQKVSPDTVPQLKDGDRLVLTLENSGRGALDVTLLYLDADLGITALFPNSLGESNRLAAASRKVIDGIEIHAPPAGTEHLLLIAVAARALGERADFSFLQQQALGTRRGEGGTGEDIFADAAFAEFRTRGANRVAAPLAGTTVQLFTLKVQR